MLGDILRGKFNLVLTNNTPKCGAVRISLLSLFTPLNENKTPLQLTSQLIIFLGLGGNNSNCPMW